MPYIQIPLNKEQKEQIIKHCELNNISQNKFIRSLINNYFNNKIVSNDFIKLDKPFYFNVNDLLNNNSVVCSLDKPTSNINNYYVIDKAINNLDKYEPNYKTFCTGGKYEHKGILINCFKIHNEIKPFYLLFEFKDNPSKENEPLLKLSIVKLNELIYNGFDFDNNKELLTELKQQETIINEYKKQENEYNKQLNKEHKQELEALNINNLENLQIEIKKNHEQLLIKLYENYNILKPYFMEHFINTLVHLMQSNSEIKNYIETTYNLTIDNLQEFKTNWSYNGKINLLFEVLNRNENEKGFLNLDTLINMELKNISLSEAIKESMIY